MVLDRVPDIIPDWKRLFAGTVPKNKNLFADPVPKNMDLFAGTPPVDSLFIFDHGNGFSDLKHDRSAHDIDKSGFCEAILWDW